MSAADLEFSLPIIKTVSSSETSSDVTTTVDGDQSCVSNSDHEQECRTPKSPENMIPAILICPPAPRKPLRRRSACKRKLCDELQFFEIVAREEVDSFFRRVEENINAGAAAKRRCVA